MDHKWYKLQAYFWFHNNLVFAVITQKESYTLKQEFFRLIFVKVDPMYSFVSARILADTGGVFAKSILISIFTGILQRTVI